MKNDIEKVNLGYKYKPIPESIPIIENDSFSMASLPDVLK